MVHGVLSFGFNSVDAGAQHDRTVWLADVVLRRCNLKNESSNYIESASTAEILLDFCVA
jgi:hypothetical protein